MTLKSLWCPIFTPLAILLGQVKMRYVRFLPQTSLIIKSHGTKPLSVP